MICSCIQDTTDLYHTHKIGTKILCLWDRAITVKLLLQSCPEFIDKGVEAVGSLLHKSISNCRFETVRCVLPLSKSRIQPGSNWEGDDCRKYKKLKWPMCLFLYSLKIKVTWPDKFCMGVTWPFAHDTKSADRFFVLNLERTSLK